jgi:hypothetical protein
MPDGPDAPLMPTIGGGGMRMRMRMKFSIFGSWRFLDLTNIA